MPSITRKFAPELTLESSNRISSHLNIFELIAFAEVKIVESLADAVS
jgi:hypothetical protein